MPNEELQKQIDDLMNKIDDIDKFNKKVIDHSHTGFQSDKVKVQDLADDQSILLTKTEKDDLTDGGTTSLHSHTDAPEVHATSHQNGGTDEISVEGLSGDLADAQDAKAHKTSHQDGGSDELDLDGLAGASIIKAFTADQAIAIRSACCLDTNGKIVECAADLSSVANKFVGFATAAISNTASGNVKMGGVMGGFSGLTIGSVYYLKNTAVVQTETITQTTNNTDRALNIAWKQFFKPTNHLLTKVQVLVHTNSTVRVLTVILRRGGTILETVNIGSQSIGVYTWKQFAFSSPHATIPGETLSIVVTAEGDSSSKWGSANTDVFGDSDEFLENGEDPGVDVGDAAFKVWEKEGDGLLDTSAGTVSKKVGIAISATEILILNTI